MRRSAHVLAGIFLLAAWPLVAVADGEPAAGAKAFGTCANCHSLYPDVNMTGPSLAGVVGRKAGSLAGFPRYSAALASSGVVWDDRTLDAWPADPAGFIPHNLMTIRGITDPQVRADLIALLHLTGPDGLTGAAATASETVDPDLTTEPPARQVRAITVCDDTYRVSTADGGMRAF